MMNIGFHHPAGCKLYFCAPEDGRENGAEPAAPASEERPEKAYSVRDMIREFGISVRTLRFYEDSALVQPKRSGNALWYDDRDRLHLRMILKGKQLGFTLPEISNILSAPETEGRAFRFEAGLNADQIAAQITHLEVQRGEIERAITRLREAQSRLDPQPTASGDDSSGEESS